MYYKAVMSNKIFNERSFLILDDIFGPGAFEAWVRAGALIPVKRPSVIDLLKNDELIAINQDELGLQARVYQREGEAYVLAKDIQQREGTSRAVALLNASNQPHTFRVALKTLCLAGKTQVRDLLHRKNLKSVKDSIIMTVEPHATACLRLTASPRLEADTYEAE